MISWLLPKQNHSAFAIYLSLERESYNYEQLFDLIYIYINLVMTWTRLFHIKNFQKAMTRVIPGKPLQQLHISKRYQAEVRKQFRMAGVPWIYDLKQEKPHHRDRQPKISKASILKEQRLQKIQKNLAEVDKKKLELRQEKLNNKPLGGIDKLISKTLPSFIKQDSHEIPEYMRKKKSRQDSD